MKPDFTIDDCNILTQALSLMRQSLMRSRNKQITGSELFNVFQREIDQLNKVEHKVFALVDSGVK